MLIIEPWNEKTDIDTKFIDARPIMYVVVARGTENGEKHEWHTPCSEEELEKAIESSRMYEHWHVEAMTLQAYLEQRYGRITVGGEK